MQKLLRWELPAAFLRQKRNESRLKSLGFCFFAGALFGVLTFAIMLGFIKPLQPIPPYFVMIAACVFVFTTIILYWLLAFISPMVVLYDKAIWLKYGYSRYSGDTTIKIPFTEISACCLIRASCQQHEYILLQLKLKDEKKFTKWELERIKEIGIPLSIDSDEIAQVLRMSGIIVVDEL